MSMNTKSLFLTLAILIMGIIGTAQPAIQFEKIAHEFGQIANLSYPPTSFGFENTGNQPLAILLVNKSPAIKVSYPRNFIQPGEKGKIMILPDLNSKGQFREEISVMTNASNTPFNLVITGEVISIQACFPNPNNWNIRKVFVIDTDTKDPVGNASIKFSHNMSNVFEGATDKEGKWVGEMPIGQYHFDLAATGYHPASSDKYVPRSLPVIFLEMDKIAPDAPVENITVTEPNIEISEEVIEPIVPINNPDLLPSNLYAANNVVLLLDVSYSMNANNKLELLKTSVSNLVDVLRGIDNVSVITYAGTPSLLIKSLPGNQKQIIKTKVMGLKASGITNGVKGLESAYDLANANFKTGGNNQIILATDGKFTGGTQQPEAFKSMINESAQKGVILSIIGFGVDADAKLFMSEMSALGKGSYIHVSTKDDISETLINEIKSKSYRGK